MQDMYDDNFDPVEYLKEIRRQRALELLSMYQKESIGEYLLSLNREMADSYYEMIVEIIPEDREVGD